MSWVPADSEDVVHPTSQSVPPPETKGRLLQPEIGAPSLEKDTVPPPSVGSTKAWKLTGCPTVADAAVEVSVVMLGVTAACATAAASPSDTNAAATLAAPPATILWKRVVGMIIEGLLV